MPAVDSGISGSHVGTLSRDAVLVGPSSVEEFKVQLLSMPASLGRERLKEYFSRGEVCLVDLTKKPLVSESENLPDGSFLELLELSDSWVRASEEVRKATRSGDHRDSAFERMFGRLFVASRAIDLVDNYLTWNLLERAVGENSSQLFWLTKILQSGTSEFNIYMGDVTNSHLERSKGYGKSSRVSALSERERIVALADFLQKEIERHGFVGNANIRISQRMPHDRQLRIALEGKGILFFGLSKGADMFEEDPITGSYSVFPKSKSDWEGLMQSNEWPRRPQRGDSWERLKELRPATNTFVNIWQFRKD